MPDVAAGHILEINVKRQQGENVNRRDSGLGLHSAKKISLMSLD